MQQRSWHKTMPLLLRIFLAVVLLISASAQVRGDVPEQTAVVVAVSAAEYREHLESLKTLVQACQANAAACDAKKIGNDERVDGGFQTRWSWLRETLANAHNATQPDR